MDIALLQKDHVALEPFPDKPAGPSVIAGFALAKGKTSLVKVKVACQCWTDVATLYAGDEVWVTSDVAENKYPIYELDGQRFIVVPQEHIVLYRHKDD
jgi:hypothetical protein